MSNVNDSATPKDLLFANTSAASQPNVAPDSTLRLVHPPKPGESAMGKKHPATFHSTGSETTTRHMPSRDFAGGSSFGAAQFPHLLEATSPKIYSAQEEIKIISSNAKTKVDVPLVHGLSSG